MSLLQAGHRDGFMNLVMLSSLQGIVELASRLPKSIHNLGNPVTERLEFGGSCRHRAVASADRMSLSMLLPIPWFRVGASDFYKDFDGYFAGGHGQCVPLDVSW